MIELAQLTSMWVFGFLTGILFTGLLALIVVNKKLK